MSKRGQVTVFIILGIVLVTVVALFLYLGGGLTTTGVDREDAEAFVASQIEPVKKVVENCVKDSLVDSILFVSIQGGYFDPVYYEDIGGYSVSYGCKDEYNGLPLLSFIEREILEYMSQDSEREKIEDCISEGFSVIESQGLDISYNFGDLDLGEPQLTDDRAIQSVSFPLTLSSYDSVASVSDVLFDVKTNLKEVYDIAVDVVNDECAGSGFEIDDYVWENSQAFESLAASISNGPVIADSYQPWYLTSYQAEENGELLRFHFLIEQ